MLQTLYHLVSFRLFCLGSYRRDESHVFCGLLLQRIFGDYLFEMECCEWRGGEREVWVCFDWDLRGEGAGGGDIHKALGFVHVGQVLLVLWVFGCSRGQCLLIPKLLEFIDVAALMGIFGGFIGEEVDDAIDSQLHADVLHSKAHLSQVSTGCRQI